jgi:molybdopterin-binding protein
MTAEAATELALAPGDAVVCVVKATNVVVEIARRVRGST